MDGSDEKYCAKKEDAETSNDENEDPEAPNDQGTNDEGITIFL